MESRSGKQCRERYINQLDPSIKKTIWTVEEDSIIKRVHFEIGKKWSRYMEQLPGRSDNAIKNRYHLISKDNYAEHNLQLAASLAIVSVKKPVADGEFEPETSAVRLDRFRCARELLDRKIKALEWEREQLMSQTAEDGEELDLQKWHTLDLCESEQEESSQSLASGDTTVECSVGEFGRQNSIESSVSTLPSTVSVLGLFAVHGEVAEYSLDNCDTQAYSIVLDEFHFDCEDMCFNDPQGLYDEVLTFV